MKIILIFRGGEGRRAGPYLSDFFVNSCCLIRIRIQETKWYGSMIYMWNAIMCVNLLQSRPGWGDHRTGTMKHLGCIAHILTEVPLSVNHYINNGTFVNNNNIFLGSDDETGAPAIPPTTATSSGTTIFSILSSYWFKKSLQFDTVFLLVQENLMVRYCLPVGSRTPYSSTLFFYWFKETLQFDTVFLLVQGNLTVRYCLPISSWTPYSSILSSYWFKKTSQLDTDFLLV